jgi:hypothetical protein
MVAHACVIPAARKAVGKRLAVPGQLQAKMSDTIWKITEAKKGRRHGSSGRAPAQQMPGPEVNPSITKKKKKQKPGGCKLMN